MTDTQTKEKFASQAAPDILAELRKIAAEEGRQFQAVLDEAMRDLIEKKRGTAPRSHILKAQQASFATHETLYEQLREQ